MIKEKKKEVEKKAVKAPEVTVLEKAEARLKSLIQLKNRLGEEGINRMSGLDLKINQASNEVTKLKGL